MSQYARKLRKQAFQLVELGPPAHRLVEAIKHMKDPTAAAYLALNMASFLPDSFELEMRKELSKEVNARYNSEGDVLR